MMIDEIERRLRLPAPDEPAILPPLYLPVQVGTAPLTGRKKSVSASVGSDGSLPLVLLGAVLLLVGGPRGRPRLPGALRLEGASRCGPDPGPVRGSGHHGRLSGRLDPAHTARAARQQRRLGGAHRRRWEVDGCEPDSAA